MLKRPMGLPTRSWSPKLVATLLRLIEIAAGLPLDSWPEVSKCTVVRAPAPELALVVPSMFA